MNETKKTKLKYHNKTRKNKISQDTYHAVPSNKKQGLFKQSKRLEEGYVEVSKLHTVYFSTYGNKNGKPVFVVNGGPGAGTTPKMSRFFDPRAYYIILVDQRGCGKSKPFGEIKDNTTQDLIKDFEKIRQHLNVDKWQVFGGSWGSTLSLAYAMAHPTRVCELVIRGIFLMRKKEVEWFNEGKGANEIFPATWKIFEDEIPVNERNDYIKAYGRRFEGKLGPKAKESAHLAWSIWEASASSLHPKSVKEIKAELMKDKLYIPISIIEYSYFNNKGFFPRDGFLLEQKNIDRIKHIPTTIVQGQFDVVCPMVSAYELHEKIPHARFCATIAGHSAYEPENIKRLVEATELYKKKKC